MGWHVVDRPASKVVSFEVSDSAIIAGNDAGGESVYDPLHDDAQAMALVKRFKIDTSHTGPDGWCATIWDGPGDEALSQRGNDDLNRAIVECVASIK